MPAALLLEKGFRIATPIRRGIDWCLRTEFNDPSSCKVDCLP